MARWTLEPSEKDKQRLARAMRRNYDETRVKKIQEESTTLEKSIIDRLNSVGFKDEKSRVQLQRDIYDYESKLAVLGGLGYDVSSQRQGLSRLQKTKDDQSNFYSQFKDEPSYFNWSMYDKYKGKSVAVIDDIISKNSVNEREATWLRENRDNFMSTDEILAEINSLEGQSQKKTTDKWLNRIAYIGGSNVNGTPNLEALADMKKASADDTENKARLRKLYELVASREDFDAETAYKEADEHNIFDVLKSDYTMADYRNDQNKKNAYGAAVIEQRDKKNFEIIKNNADEFNADASKVESIIFNKTATSDLASSSLGTSLANTLNQNSRIDLIMSTDPEIQSIIKKWADKGYDFNSLYETFDRQANEKFSNKVKEWSEEYTQEHPILGNITSVGTNVIGGIAALPSVFETAVKDVASDDIVPLDTNAPEWALKNVTDKIRDTTASIIAENNDGIKGDFYNFLYQTGMSMADMGASFLAGGFNPTVYPLIMSSNAAVDKIKTVTENGGNINEALLSGLMAGAFEAVFEKIGIDNLVENITSAAGRSVLKTFFNGFLSEGLEELGTDVANSVADAVINGDRSELNNNIYAYIQQGHSASEANALALTDLAKQYMTSFAGGALSGGIIGGVAGGINSAAVTRKNSRLGKETMAEGSTEYLMELALAQAKARESGELNDALAAVDKQQKRQEKKIYKSTGKTEMKVAIKDRLRVLGMEASEIDAAAQELTEVYFKKSKKLKNYAGDKTVQRVLSELGNVSQQEDSYTNEWAQTADKSIQSKAESEAKNNYRARDIGAVRRAVASITPEYEMQHQTFRTEAKMTEKEKRFGAAVEVNTNKNVTVSKVLEKADGGLVVQLTNGKKGFVASELNAKSELPQIRMSNTDANQLMTVASHFESAESVNVFITSVRENQDVVEYSKEFKQAYTTGLNDNDFSEEDYKGYNTITADQIKIAYQAGVRDSAVSYVAAVDDTNTLFEKVKKESFSSGVTRLDNKEVNNSYRIKSQLKVLNAYGKKHNLSFIIADKLETEQGTANGVYLGENKIVISAQAESGAILSVAGHEVYHYLEANNKDGAKALREWVLDYLDKKEDFDLEGRREALRKDYGADADVDAEIVANSMFEVLANEKTINELAEENPSLLKKLLKHINAFIADIKSIIAQLGNNWAEVKALSKDLQALESIRWLMESALSQIDTTSQTQKNTANNDGDVKYSRIPTQKQFDVIRTIGRKSINAFTSSDIKKTEYWARIMYKQLGVKSPFFRAWFGDWRAYDRTPVTVATKRGANRGQVKNNDTDYNINISATVFNETKSHRSKAVKNAVPYLDYIEDIVKNAILLDTFVVDNPKSENSLFMHSFYAVANIGNGNDLLKLFVEEMNDPNSTDTTKRAYQLQYIKIASAASVRVQNNPSSLTNTANAIHNVANLFSVVKQHDKNFKPNAVNEYFLSEQWLPIEYYHGTNADFSVFDRTKSSKKVHLNVLGDGNYFTANKDVAGRYGKNTIGAYIKINNPYIFKSETFNTVADQISAEYSVDRNSIKGSQVQTFLKNKGFDGVISLDENDKAVVVNVFDSNQIKSATDNIGTFDKDNPDIRYSYASRKAKNANLTKYAEAVRLESEGHSSEEIRQQTGWFRGYDNKWRFEIDDSKMKISTSGLYSRNPDVRRYQELQNKIYFEDNATDAEKTEFKQLLDSLEGVQMKPRLLGDLIDHEELFTAYPQLQDVFITYKKDTGNADGWYDPIINEIVINQSAVLQRDRLREILIHEIQHAIQHIEGLAEGASPDLYKYDKNAKYETLSQRKLAEAEKKLREQMSMSSEDISAVIAQYNSETMYEGMTESEYARAYDRAAAQIKDEYLQDAFWDYSVARERAYKELATIEKDSPMDSYLKTAGEIEARDAARRVNFDADKRKNTRPDIDREDVVFAEGGTSYEIKTDVDGNMFVEVDGNIFDGANGKSHAAVIAKILSDKFNNLIVANKQLIRVNSKTNKEWRRSPDAQKMIRTAPDMYFDKLQTIGNADEILTVAKDWIGEELQHSRIDDIIEFARGTIDYKVGENGYSADILVATKKDGSALLYDIIHIKSKKITDASRGSHEKTATSRHNASVDNNIPQSEDDVKPEYSLQSTDEAGKAREKLIRQNKNLRVANMILKQELVQTNGNMLSYDVSLSLAREIKRAFQSSYDSDTLAEEIYNAFKWYDRTDNSYEQLVNYFTSLGEKVVAESSALDTTLYDDYAEARKWIRNMEFALPEHVLKQLNENYSGKFVTQTFGRMKYVSKEKHPDAPYLSAIYSELASEYPNFFSEEDNEYEQPQKLIDFWKKIQPTFYNPYTDLGFASVEEASVGFAYELFNRYLDKQKHETFADKQRTEREKLKKEYADNLESALLRERWKTSDMLKKQKEYYIGLRNKNSDERRKTLVKKKLQNVIKELDKYLNRGTKDKNVKLEMQETVFAALSSAEVLFSDSITNEDFIRAGIENSPVLSSADGREEIWLTEYKELLEKRDKLLETYAAVNDQTLSEKSLNERESIEAELQHLEDRQKELDKSLKELFDRELRRLNKVSADDVLIKLSSAYKSLENSEQAYISNAYNEKLYEHLEKIRKDLKGANVRQMNVFELENVYEAYKMVLHTVRTANKLFAEGRNETVEELANNAMNEIKAVGGYRDKRASIQNVVEKFGWNELKPIYAFRTIGSDTLTDRYKALRKGEDTYYSDVAHAKEFAAAKKKEYDFGSWKLDEKYTFISKNNEEFTLTLEQIMSLYAYSRRGDQAVEHITRGGIVHSGNIKEKRDLKNGKLLSYDMENAAAYSITVETFGEIVDKLTEKQRRYVEDMQKYLSEVMGDKGNEISMKMYGIKLFKEKIYFPLKSSSYYRAFKGEQDGEALLKNSGFTNATVPHANNPIVVDDFNSVWSSHVHDMSMYHSFVLPLEDFMRIYNYKSITTEDTPKTYSFKATLQGAYGEGAKSYIETFIRDINGGVQVQGGTEFANKLTSLSKKSAVFASLSVVIQQPSAVVRATALINPKYFMQGMPESVKWTKVSKEYEELKKYAPVAGIKQMGYFDTGLGRSAAEWIMSDKYDTFGQKVNGFLKDGSYRDEVFSALPAKADELSWVCIWNAVKQEVADTGKYSVDSQKYLEACGERFTEIIELTQVYDSVFSRSGFMRSKDSLVKMATSFMAEPTVQINMLADAIIQGKRGDEKYRRAAIASVYVSILANAMLKSLVTAGRDDDEDLNYLEKYIANVIGSSLQDGLMLSSIPYLRDMISIFQGYEVERMDMAVVSDLFSAIYALGNENKTTWDKIKGFIGAFCNCFGLPVKNMIRDAEAVVNTVKTALKNYSYSPNAQKEAIIRSITNKNTAKGELLYNAIVNGDEEYMKRVKALYDNEESINAALRIALRKNDERIVQAAQAKLDGNFDEYMRITQEMVDEKKFSQDNIVSAISAQMDAMNTQEKEESPDKKKGLFTDDDYLSAILSGAGTIIKAIADDIIKTDVANGKTKDEAEKLLVSDLKNNLKEEYELGGIEKAEAVEILVNYCGIDKDKAQSRVEHWAFSMEHPDVDVSEEALAEYNESLKSSGISIDVFIDYYVKQKDCTADVDENGKAISGSKKAKILKIINSLPISSAQKDKFYYLNGYAKSTISDTPWH